MRKPSVRLIMILVITLMVLWPPAPPSTRALPTQGCDANCCYCCFQAYDSGGNCTDFSFHASCGPFFACHQEWGCWGTVCLWPMGISVDMICAVAFIGC
jgi:hypothetical protein